jgi:hypothetical protein
MAITSEQVWNAPSRPAPRDDAFAFGEPFDPERLRYRFDPAESLRRATSGFFDERDRDHPIGATLVKMIGVVALLTGALLTVLATLGIVSLMVFRAMLG